MFQTKCFGLTNEFNIHSAHWSIVRLLAETTSTGVVLTQPEQSGVKTLESCDRPKVCITVKLHFVFKAQKCKNIHSHIKGLKQEHEMDVKGMSVRVR